MHVLVTRPEPDAAELKAALEVLGHEVSLEPLLAISSLPIEPTVFEGARGVIVTSRNGLRALAGSAGLARQLSSRFSAWVRRPRHSRVNLDLSKLLPAMDRRATSLP